MRPDNITNFQVEFYRSTLYQQQFAIVTEPNEEPPDINLIEELKSAYIKYHLAIKPNVPVIIFYLESAAGVGCKIFGGTPETPVLYHIPPRSYEKLDVMVKEAPFCVSQSYVEHALRSNHLHRSIFGLLPATQKEVGLNVLGIL